MTNGKLFENRSAEQSEGKAKSEKVHPFAAIFGTYREEYKARWGQSPVITPADARAVKLLVQDQGEEKVRGRVPVFLSLKDPYLAREGYPLRLMPSSWNRMTAMELQSKMNRDRSAERTSAYLRRLRGETT